jgi:signal transduction histidine kinase
MPAPRLRITPPSWLRLPRRTARRRLTALYGGVFLMCGAAVLALTYLLDGYAAHLASAITRLPVGAFTSGAFGPAAQRDSALPVVALQGKEQAKAAAVKAALAQIAFDRQQLLITSAVALAAVAVAAVAIGWVIAGRVLRPLSTITAAARRISASSLHERLALPGPDDELKELADTLDNLLARLDAAFDAQRRFVASASHELRTPLTAERTLLQVALDDPDTTSEDWRSTAKEVLASNAEQERLIEALLALASSEGGLDHREPVDLPAICHGILARPGLGTGALGLHIETAIRAAPLDGDPLLIERLVANLVDNAVGHNVTGGQVWVATAVTGSTAVLTVANTGPVIPGGDVDRLFQPFQRLDPGRAHHQDGYGLGLSIVRAIATAHGATITARPRPGGGLAIDIAFPPPSASAPPQTRRSREWRESLVRAGQPG